MSVNFEYFKIPKSFSGKNARKVLDAIGQKGLRVPELPNEKVITYPNEEMVLCVGKCGDYVQFRAIHHSKIGQPI